MPYPIRSTAGDSLLPILRKATYGNIGVNQGGYGSTVSTGFWNGKPPNVGGYVVYVGNLSNSPTMYVVATDNQLITLSNTLGGGSNTTIGLALNYFMNAINMVCFDVEPLNVVTDGLYLYLDAGFACSYPRIGTAWNDISRGSNNGTLINGPTYSSAGGGCIVSDGSDDGVTITDDIDLDLTNFTLDGWVWFNQHKNFGSLLVKGPGGSGQLFNYCFFFYETSIICGFGDGSNFYSAGVLTTPNVPINTWHHIVGVYDSVAVKFYLNGVLMQSNPIVATPYQNTNNLNIIQSDYPIDGKVISAKVYNRALSLTEIKQNYYAGLQRLIPTDNMVLWLDGTNTNTRVITPTTAYDRSGNNNNGVLQNSMGLAHRDGGTVFSFDGVDDRLVTSMNTLTPSTSWTVWVKRTESINAYNMIMGMYLPYFAFRSDGSIHFSNLINGVQQSLFAYPSLVNDVWYHMSFVSSFSAGNTTMFIYLNGVLQTQGTYTGQQWTTTNDGFRLGSWYSGYTELFKGKIGDVRMYSRVLTATEISTIYNAGRTRYGV